MSTDQTPTPPKGYEILTPEFLHSRSAPASLLRYSEGQNAWVPSAYDQGTYIMKNDVECNTYAAPVGTMAKAQAAAATPASETPTPLTDAFFGDMRGNVSTEDHAVRHFARDLERRLADAESRVAALESERATSIEHNGQLRASEAGAAALREALCAVLDSAVEPEKAKFASMVDLAPVRKALATEAGAATLKELTELREENKRLTGKCVAQEKGSRVYCNCPNCRGFQTLDRLLKESVAERDDASAKLKEAEVSKACAVREVQECHAIEVISYLNESAELRAKLAEAERMLVKSQLDILSLRKESEAKIAEANAKLAEVEEANAWKISPAMAEAKIDQLHAQLAEAVRERDEARARLSEISDECGAPRNASYEYDATPTADERLSRVAAIADAKRNNAVAEEEETARHDAGELRQNEHPTFTAAFKGFGAGEGAQ